MVMTRFLRSERPSESRIARFTRVVSVAIGLGCLLPVIALSTSLRPVRREPGLDAVPGYDGWTATARSVEAIAADGVAGMVAVIVGLAVAVVATAALNLFSLETIEGARRRPETALRVALGARRRHLASHMLRWRLPLFAGGLVLGSVAASGFVFWAGATLPAGQALPDRLRLGPNLLLWGIVSATVLVVAFPLLSLLRRAPRSLTGRFRTGGLQAPDRTEATWHGLVTVLQIGGACGLMAAAGLLLHGTRTVDATGDLPFSPDTVVVSYTLPAGLDAGERAAIHGTLAHRARGIPGVTAASVASDEAWLGLGPEDGVVGLGLSFLNPVQRATTRHLLVDPHFFDLLESGSNWGRAPTRAAGPDGVKEVAVNRTATRRLLLGADPLGKDLHLARLDGPTYRVTGVAPDIRAPVPGTGWEAIPAVYLSILAHPPARAGLLVRGMEDPDAVERMVLPVLRRAAPGATFDQAESVWSAYDRAAAPLRWLGWIAAALAVGTLMLSLLGIHAVIGDLVRRLRSEIGLRKAVGGTRRHILGMVGRRVARLTAGGLALGTAIALSLGRLVQFVQHGVPMYDPLIHAITLAMVAITVGLAAWRPAFDAAGVPPAVALRGEGG
jgi:putative ABC transport system permease protein